MVVVLIFGTEKLKNIGGGHGGALKTFKDGLREGTTNDTALHRKSRDRSRHDAASHRSATDAEGTFPSKFERPCGHPAEHRAHDPSSAMPSRSSNLILKPQP